MARRKKISMRLVVSIVAVLMLAVAVPLSVTVADGMNGMIGGGETIVYDAKSAKDFSSTVPSYSGVYHPEYRGAVVVYHINSDDHSNYDVQTNFPADLIDEEHNQVIINYLDATQAAERATYLAISLDYSVGEWIHDGAESLEISLNYSRDVKLRFYSGTYFENSGNGFTGAALSFNGYNGDIVKSVRVPVTITVDDPTHGNELYNNFMVNLTTEMQSYTLTPSKIDLMRAFVYLSDCDMQSVSIALNQQAGDTDEVSIISGDVIKYNVKINGVAVNGFMITDIFIGILGVGLITGAVFATPWVGRGTFDDVRSKVSRKSRRKSRGRR